MIKTKPQREAGLEILRIISIILITCVHMLSYGGFLNNATSAEELLILRLLYSLFTVSVNVFVIISAYFMVKSNIKPRKIISLWLTVVFYSASLYLISVIFFQDKFIFKEFIKCFMPFIYKKYWFFTAYFIIYLISPFLNKILNNSSKKECLYITILIFTFSYISLRFNADIVAGLSSGYNVIWFICLYLIGGMLRLHPLKIKKFDISIIYISSILIIWINHYYPADGFLYNLLHFKPKYTDPIVLIASISIFLLFNGITLKSITANKIIRYISSTTFGIYLLQDGNLIKPHLYFDILQVQNYYGRMSSIFYIFLFVLAIFLIGFIYDSIRQLIFRIFKPLADKIEILTINKIDKIKDRKNNSKKSKDTSIEEK